MTLPNIDISLPQTLIPSGDSDEYTESSSYEQEQDPTTSAENGDRRRDHPKSVVVMLENWYLGHQNADGRAYLTLEDKKLLAEACGLSFKQVTTWVSNRRNRRGR